MTALHDGGAPMRAFLPTTTISAAELIAQIERHALDTQPVAARPIFGQIDTVAWQQIRGLSRFWESTTTPSMAVPGLHGSGAPFALLFYMLSDGILHIAIGMPAEFSNLLVWTLQGVFPGIMLTAHEPKLGTMLSDAGLFANSGHITGIPTLKVVSTGTQRPGIPSGEVPIQQIERIIRGMGRRPWGYYLRATPVAVSEVLAWREGTLQVIRAYDEQAGITVQRTDTKITRGDREAQRCVTLLEQQLERLDRGRAQGMWCVEGHFFTPHAERIGQLAGLLRATFAGDVSRLEPFRTHIHVPDASKGTPDMLQTILHTDELAAFVQLPTEELPGYQLRDYIRFDVDL